MVSTVFSVINFVAQLPSWFLLHGSHLEYLKKLLYAFKTKHVSLSRRSGIFKKLDKLCISILPPPPQFVLPSVLNTLSGNKISWAPPWTNGCHLETTFSDISSLIHIYYTSVSFSPISNVDSHQDLRKLKIFTLTHRILGVLPWHLYC